MSLDVKNVVRSVFQLGEAPTQQDAIAKKLSWNLLNPLTGTAYGPHLSLLSTPALPRIPIISLPSVVNFAALPFRYLTLLWVCADEADEAAAPKASGCFLVAATMGGLQRLRELP